MITIHNYLQNKPSRASLTEGEQMAFDILEEGGIEIYDADAGIAETLDMYFAALNAKAAPKSEPAQKAKSGAINERQPNELPYIGFYNNKQVELYAIGLYAAKVKAIQHFKAPKSKEYMVHVHLAEDEEPTPAPTKKAPKPRKKLPMVKPPKGRAGKPLKRKEAPATKPIETPKPKKNATKKLPKAVKSADNGPKRTKVKKHGDQAVRLPVSSFDNDLTFIRQFLGLTKGEVTRKRVGALHKKLEKAIVSRKVRKASPHADLLTDIATLVKKAYGTMTERNIESVAELKFSDSAVVRRARQVADAQAIRPAVPLLSTFINLQGSKPEAKTVAALVKKMEKVATEQPNDDYAPSLRAAIAVLRDWKPGAAVRITQHQLSGLQGLSGLGCPDDTCGCSGK